METAFLAEVATIVGAVSILLTLVFVVIELKNNAAQARAANIASRDQQHSQFMRYWFEEENFALVQKGREDYLKASKKTTKIKHRAAKPKLSYEEQKRLKSELKRKTRIVNELEADYQSLETQNNENMALLFDYEKFSKLSQDEQKEVMHKKSILEKKLSDAIIKWEQHSTQLEKLQAQIEQ